MNSINLPPIRKIGPAIAPKPKNIKIHAGKVIWLNKHEIDDKNNNDIFHAKLVSFSNEPKYDYEKTSTRDSFEFPAPPSPEPMTNLNLNMHDNSLNSTINVTTDPNNKGPIITITQKNSIPNTTPLNSTSRQNSIISKENETNGISIPVQHSPTTTKTTIKPFQLNLIPNQSNTNRSIDSLSPRSNIIIQNNRSLNDEIDLAQQILMRNLLGSKDEMLIGICGDCKEPILGVDNGLKALDQLFHVKCFVCLTCKISLKDKHFYAIENKYHCENCYMKLLEKCCACDKPITDRILRATGKPFHPECFCCTVCKLNLDGVPFTVDSKNKIHCIDCFHEKYAPRCYICNRSIIPENGQEETVRIVAMDKSFHVDCYRCEDCGVSLSTNSDKVGGCYPLDDHIYCKTCNLQRNLKKANLFINNRMSPSTSSTHVSARQTDL